MENHRRAGAGFGGPGRLRILGLLQDGYEVPSRHPLLRTRCHQARP